MKYLFSFLLLVLVLLSTNQGNQSTIHPRKNDLNNKYSRKPASIVKKTINSCSSFLRMIKGDRFTQEDFIWGGSKLSDAQIRQLVKFTKRAGRKIQKGDEITIWQPQEMRIGEAIEGERIPQYIRRNGSFENDLLSSSMIDTSPREVLQIKLHYSDGRVRILNKIYGNSRGVDFSKAEWDLRMATRGNLAGIRRIEIAHTHPTYALTIVSKDGNRYSRPNEISKGDYAMISSFMSRLPRSKEVCIKAITPNGFYYESNFVSQ